MKKESIFDLTHEDWNYRGVLFAELDNSEIQKEVAHFPEISAPKGYIAGIMGLIWTDEKGIFHLKFRIKFPSGNKHAFEKSFIEEHREGINMNETYCLSWVYKFPMKNKKWTKNECGTGMGILNIIRDLDMIESIRVIGEK